MIVRCLPKPTLETFIQTCTPLAVIAALEARMADFAPNSTPLANLSRFLAADCDYLGVVLAFANLSQEKLLRLLSAERFAQGDFGNEWNIETVCRKLHREPEFAERIAQLFLNGREDPLLRQHIAAFHLDQLALPENWAQLLSDRNIMRGVVRKKLQGEYTNLKGAAIEGIIRAELERLQALYGVGFAKGQVPLVGKEVDHALPSLTDPHVLIMTSYMETTSSSQTTRANEQSAIYTALQTDNIRYGKKRVLVNFVDGAGWLARRSDLRKLYDGCDYIINLQTLDRLEGIFCKYLPESAFTRHPRPEVTD